MTHTPAVIRNLDSKNPHQDEIQCMFNPKEYGVSRKNKWTAPSAKGKPLAEYEFGGGDPATMTLSLLFDTFDEGVDVRTKYTKKVWDLMDNTPHIVDKKTKTGRPPRVLFQWGNAFSFVAVITSISQKFVLFKDDGIPVRATLEVGFQQVKDPHDRPGQNPTSGGMGGSSEWIVKDGDTLASIAYAEYGDSNSWRPIADANRLANVRRLRPGLVLEIPGLG